MTFRKILVPLDGSAFSEAALLKAVEIATSPPGSSLLLIRATEAPVLPGGDPAGAQATVVREAEEYLARLAARVSSDGAPDVSTSVWYGPAASAVVEAARTAGSDLIVMSTHGRSGLGRLFLGSVAESVLRSTETPILLLRPSEAPAAPLRAGEARSWPAQGEEGAMHVGELMVRTLITVKPATPVTEARTLMSKERIRHLLVTDGDRLAGIVTDRDIRLNLASPATTLSVWELNYLLARLTVADVMTKSVITIDAGRDAREAARLMLDHKIGALPVLESGRLVGILTETDLVRAFAEKA